MYVQRIAYDAKGQRALIAYGNGVMTRYAYDPHTFRLARLRSEPYTVDGVTYRPAGAVAAGPRLRLRPGRQHPAPCTTGHPGCGVPPTASTPSTAAFTYDPVYRLRSATGRESRPRSAATPGPTSRAAPTRPRPSAYTETYDYDRSGNLLQLAHRPTAAHLTSGFTRDFAIQPGSNRLPAMTVGGTPYDYAYDANGNLITETTSRHFTWNHADQLATFATQTPGAEPSVHAQYLYDPPASG